MSCDKPRVSSRFQAGGTITVHLLRDVEKYLKARDIAAARFGREAMGDPRFVFDLRNGREPRARTVRKIRAYLDQKS